MHEAAECLGCGVTTVKRRIAAGRLPAFRDGRLVRVRRGDLERYVAERTTRRAGRTEVFAGRPLAPGTRLWD